MELPHVNHTWLLVAALAVLLMGIIFWLRNFRAPSRLTHALVIALLLLALAEPRIDHHSPVGSVTALVDISKSISDTFGQSLIDYLQKYRAAGINIKLKPFSEKTSSFTTEETGFSGLQREFESLGASQTNLNQAVRSLAGEESALLLSDGNATQGGAVQTGTTKLYPIIVGNGSVRDDLELKQLLVPLRAPKDTAIPIRVSIKNHGTRPNTGMLTITIDKQTLTSGNVRIDPGAEKIIEFKADSSGEDLETVTAKLSQSNDVQEQKAYVTPAVRDTIVLLSGNEEDERYLKKVLQDESFELITSVGNVSSETFSQINKAKTVILNNLPFDALGGEERGRQLANAVRQGVGLVTIGGPKSYGLGGYRGSSLESSLAVVPLPPQQQEKRLNVAVELIIDKSSSMKEEGRLESAKDAARETIKMMKDDDYIGIYGFDTTPFEVVRLGRLSDIRDMALERVGRLYPAYSTHLYPTLEEGRRRLEVAPASRKHMIVLTDGKIPDADNTYKVLVQDMRVIGITVSTVLVSDENDFGFLEELANIGGGTFYRTSDPSNLPRIFLQDVRVRSGEQTLKEQQNYEVAWNESIRNITPLKDFPTLRGYVDTAPAKDSQVELTIRDNNQNKPLLAERTIGAGRSIAYTSDANGRWSNQWIGWSDFRKFWFDVMQRASRPDENKGGHLKYEVETSLEHGMQTIWITTYGGVPQRLPELNLAYENGQKQKINMSAEAKGRYFASFAPLATGKLLVNPVFDGTQYPGVGIFVDPQKLREDPKRDIDGDYLATIASQTGGIINPDPKLLLSNEKHEIRFFVRPLLLAAVLLYLASLALRVLLVSKNKK